MTNREAAIITAYTGILIGSMSCFHKYAEKKFCRPVFTHEMADKKFWDTLKKMSRQDFMELNESIEDEK